MHSGYILVDFCDALKLWSFLPNSEIRVAYSKEGRNKNETSWTALIVAMHQLARALLIRQAN
jgi:hypothetical protein